MSNEFDWQCPFCGNHSTITEERYSSSSHRFRHGNKHGDLLFASAVIVCSNPKCKEFALHCELSTAKYSQYSGWEEVKSLQKWNLIPAALIKIFPDYVPAPILSDYREACLIRELSPKASATLARRCLQGMIRDFWGVTKPKLVQEIEAIEDKVDASTWKAIDSVRSIGNIGAHMEKDINLVVDVDPGEAGLLIGLIETLIVEWYMGRHEREKRMEKIISAAEKKKAPPHKS